MRSWFPAEDHRLTGPPWPRPWTPIPIPASVVALVATAGTTNAGIIDDLASLADVAEQPPVVVPRRCRLRGAALFAPSVRDRFAGIERADSFVVDPHKWLFAPFDCAALIYRHPQLARAVHTQDASYLDVLHTDAPDEWNPSDYAYHLTRRARGLPLWFSLAVNGTDLYRDAVESALELARQTAARIEATPYLGLLAPPGAVGRAVPPAWMGARRLRGLVEQAARGSDRVRDADEMVGRDGGSHGLPAPATRPSRWSTRSWPPWPDVGSGVPGKKTGPHPARPRF